MYDINFKQNCQTLKVDIEIEQSGSQLKLHITVGHWILTLQLRRFTCHFINSYVFYLMSVALSIGIPTPFHIFPSVIVQLSFQER